METSNLDAAPSTSEKAAIDFDRMTIAQLREIVCDGPARDEKKISRLEKKCERLKESIDYYHGEKAGLDCERLSFTPRPDATDADIADWLEELARRVFQGPLREDTMAVAQALRDRK